MRVVAGRLGGRSLKAPPGDATRPTGARVKEALFSILGDVSEARVLDLYSGSGALGIEALSRGAARAVFVEAARPALACLRENLQKLGLEPQTQVLTRRLETLGGELARLGPFDLVLCDPPWRDVASAREQLEALAAAGVFAQGVRVALEHSAKAPPPAPIGDGVGKGCLLLQDQRRWGDTGVQLLGLTPSPADAPGAAEP